MPPFVFELTLYFVHSLICVATFVYDKVDDFRLIKTQVHIPDT